MRVLMSPDRQSSLSLVRRMVVANLDRPVPEVIERALQCLIESLDARAAFLGRIDDGALEILAAVSTGGPPLERGLRFQLEETFLRVKHGDAGVVNVRDASKQEPFKALRMRRQLEILSYLGVNITLPGGETFGTLAVLGKGTRVFTEQDQDLVQVIAGLLAPRLKADDVARVDGHGRVPVSAIRLASADVKEPLAILRGYADMLTNNEVPPAEMPLVARRLAMQSETLIRVADQVLLMSRLPLELAFTVRVSLVDVSQSSAQRIRRRMADAGMDLRLQFDAHGEVWGDVALLEAALDEMLQNVLTHARTATVVQLRLRESARDRVQLIVKDDGPGISADRLAELFGSMPSDEHPPARGRGLGVYLLRRVAAAHGGRAWANSLEGKGTTFYLELPAASPDGDSVRASVGSQASA
ncbi:MAG: GAF domain-containing sensor histidine kinase [Candidatus Dormibacteraeota bacterium]|nr:GAF domain-containing sensor histidine kinase [Candidatus Dormibacteraeota bacterium]